MAEPVQIDDKALRKRLGKMQKNISNPSPILKKVSQVYMFKDVLNHFNKEQGPRGRWRRTQRGGRVLQDTGRLRNSIRPRSTRDEAVVGTNVIYAATHNYGRGNIPQRKFMWLSKSATKIIIKVLGKFFIAE